MQGRAALTVLVLLEIGAATVAEPRADSIVLNVAACVMIYSTATGGRAKGVIDQPLSIVPRAGTSRSARAPKCAKAPGFPEASVRVRFGGRLSRAMCWRELRTP